MAQTSDAEFIQTLTSFCGEDIPGVAPELEMLTKARPASKTVASEPESPSAQSTAAGGSIASSFSDCCSPDWRSSTSSAASPVSAAADRSLHVYPCVVKLCNLAKIPMVEPDTLKLLVRTVQLLQLCEYELEDICCVLAHGAAYFEAFGANCGKKMSNFEAGYILVVFIYIAHSYVLDETCPMKFWHQKLFRHYCSPKMLDAAVIRLMRMRDYRLRLEDHEVQTKIVSLLTAARAGTPTGRSAPFGSAFGGKDGEQ